MNFRIKSNYRMEEQNCKSFKIVLVGNNSAGNTCLLHRFANNKFVWDLNATIGASFTSKIVELDGKKIKLDLWDTAGHESFRKTHSVYYRGAMGVVLAYDITDEESFENINLFMREIDKHAPADAEKILLGNKCDMNDRRQVSKERGEELALEYGIKFMETSAKSNINVENAFLTLARDINTKMDSKMEANPPQSSSQGEPQGNSSCSLL